MQQANSTSTAPGGPGPAPAHSLDEPQPPQSASTCMQGIFPSSGVNRDQEVLTSTQASHYKMLAMGPRLCLIGRASISRSTGNAKSCKNAVRAVSCWVGNL